MDDANQDLPRSSSPRGPVDDLPPGPEGWQLFVVRSFLRRLERGAEEEREDGPRRPALPPPSDRERLVRDCLTGLYGPLAPGGVPERWRGGPEAEEALRRQRERRAKGRRRAALRRIARRFQRPIPAGRWHVLAADAAAEYERREEGRKRLTPWWVKPDAPREAQLGAASLALADERVLGSFVEELPARLKTAIADALGTDLAGVDWVARSEPAEKRRPPATAVDEVPETLLLDRDPGEEEGPLSALAAAEETRARMGELHRLATDRQSEQLEEIRRQLAAGFDLPEAKRRAAKTLDVSVNALDATLSRLRSKAG